MKDSTNMESETESLLNIEFCEELQAQKKSNSNSPNWENIELTIYEIIQHELQEYSQREKELEILVCEDDEWYISTIKKGGEILIKASVDDLSGEYYLTEN